MLERGLRAAGAEDLSIAKLWMNAARARPHDVELQENWMMVNFDAGEWKQAQSVWIPSYFSPYTLAVGFDFLKQLAGSYDAPEELPKEAALLLLGYTCQSSGQCILESVGDRSKALWTIGLQDDHQSCLGGAS